MRRGKVQDIKKLADLKDVIKEHEKKPGFKTLLDEARLRLLMAHEIRRMREKAHLTQGQLARAIGVSQPLIGRLESVKDERIPGLELLAKISHATKQKIDVKSRRVRLTLAVK